jgi:acyl-CoA synthetase (AMP-forming)/AMP-acid ligase II/acyl carrier protein
VWEIWPYLTAGASLHIPPDETLNNPEALRDWLVANEITITFVPTPMAERLLALTWPTNARLRTMLTGGDVLHRFPGDVPFTLVNNYGPTECTVVATSCVVPTCDEQAQAKRLPPIGSPIDNTQIYVLDKALQPVPPGTPGELYIGGAGIARGYRRRPDLTAERFIADPFSKDASARLFKTGDSAQILPDGQIAFLGRLDDQVKVRGFRIEPDEIVAALDGHPNIAQSAVVAQKNGSEEKRLVAYVVSKNCVFPGLSELREFLSHRIPDYMMPAIFVRLGTLPLTANGKVDRHALPPPDASNSLHNEDFAAPRTEVEVAIAGLLAPLLGIEQVDVKANFFALGGHSLLGTQLIARLRDSFGVELPLRSIFEAPTVSGLATEIERLLLAKLDAMSEEEAQRMLNSTQRVCAI